MRATISIPDALFASVDELAAEWGVSRSEVYARAVAELLAKHRSADVTARLNEVYGSEPSRLDPGLQRAQERALRDADA